MPVRANARGCALPGVELHQSRAAIDGAVRDKISEQTPHHSHALSQSNTIGANTNRADAVEASPTEVDLTNTDSVNIGTAGVTACARQLHASARAHSTGHISWFGTTCAANASPTTHRGKCPPAKPCPTSLSRNIKLRTRIRLYGPVFNRKHSASCSQCRAHQSISRELVDPAAEPLWQPI